MCQILHCKRCRKRSPERAGLRSRWGTEGGSQSVREAQDRCLFHKELPQMARSPMESLCGDTYWTPRTCGPQSRHQASIWKIDPGQLGRTTIVRDFVMTIRSLPTSELTPLWSGESRSIGLDYQAWPSTLYSCQGYGSYSIIPNQWDILNTSIAH